MITHSSPVIAADPDTAVLLGKEPNPVESRLQAPPVTFEIVMVPFTKQDGGLVPVKVAVVAICVNAKPAFDPPPPSETRYSNNDVASK